MENSDEPKQFLEALVRLRESCVFYFKFDVVLIAAIAAVASFLKLEETGLLQAATQYKDALYYLILLLVYSLAFELIITSTSNRKDLGRVLAQEKYRATLYRAFSWGYCAQVFAHIILLIGVLAYASGYVDSFACRTDSSRCAT